MRRGDSRGDWTGGHGGQDTTLERYQYMCKFNFMSVVDLHLGCGCKDDWS